MPLATWATIFKNTAGYVFGIIELTSGGPLFVFIGLPVSAFFLIA